MSELKAYRIKGDTLGDFPDVYLKSEADKVIAHQKYKRCLAMADYCFARSVAEDVLNTNRDGIEHSDYWLCRHKMWLALAQKFKEAK